MVDVKMTSLIIHSVRKPSFSRLYARTTYEITLNTIHHFDYSNFNANTIPYTILHNEQKEIKEATS
jgi:hypothetical protein